MSRRTVIRYVNAKAELAFVHPVLWLDVFDTALAEASDLAPVARLRHASLAIADHVDTDPAPVRRAFIVAASHPDLLTGFQAVYARWVDHLSTVVANLATNDIPFEARILGAAIMGMVDAVTRDWLLSDTSYAAALERGFAVIEPLLAETLNPVDD